jgi:hypothetical protein
LRVVFVAADYFFENLSRPALVALLGKFDSAPKRLILRHAELLSRLDKGLIARPSANALHWQNVHIISDYSINRGPRSRFLGFDDPQATGVG